jgi:hypothetical protein
MARRLSRAARAPSVLGRGDLTTSLLLIAPLFLAYEIGVMFSTTINGVDFVTHWIYLSVGSSRANFLLLHLVLAAIYLGWALRARRRRELTTDTVLPMVMESGIYALTLGTFIVFVMQRLLGFAVVAFAPIFGDAALDQLSLGSTGEAVVISLGAGVHEELVFRLGLMAGGAALLRRLDVRHSLAVALALVGSSLIFSVAHHAGPNGEPFELSVFTYRAMAGGIFGLIFYYRSLAHAVYSHFLYDLYVLVLR